MEESFLLKELVFLFHLIGFALIASPLFSGPITEKRFQRAETLETKVAIQRILRSLGLLSPLAVLLLLASGVGNMYYSGLGPFTAGWLSAKIIFFVIAVVNGTMAGLRGGQRGKLLARLTKGETIPDALPRLQRLNKQQSTFYLTQTILIFIILALSVFKPE